MRMRLMKHVRSKYPGGASDLQWDTRWQSAISDLQYSAAVPPRRRAAAVPGLQPSSSNDLRAQFRFMARECART